MGPTAAYEANRFLKDHNKFYSDVLINEDLSSDETIKFLKEEQNENVVERSEEEEHDTMIHIKIIILVVMKLL